jgi:hypothetical protein
MNESSRFRAGESWLVIDPKTSAPSLDREGYSHNRGADLASILPEVPPLNLQEMLADSKQKVRGVDQEPSLPGCHNLMRLIKF